MKFVMYFLVFVLISWLESKCAAQAPRLLDYVVRELNSNIKRLEQEILRSQRDLAALPELSTGLQGECIGYHSRFIEAADTPLTIRVDLKRTRKLDLIALVPVSTVFQGVAYSGYGFPQRFVVEVSNDESFRVANVVFQADRDVGELSDYPLIIPVSKIEARYVRIRVSEHWQRTDGRFLTALSELMVLSGSRNVAIGAEVEAPAGVSLPVWSHENLVDGQTNLGLPTGLVASRTNGFRSDAAALPGVSKWVQVDLGRTVPLEEIRLIPAQPFDAPNRNGHGFPSRFRVTVSQDADFSNWEMIADYTSTRFPNPGDNPVILASDGVQGRFIRLEAVELWHISGGKYALALSELQAFARGRNVAMGASVSASDMLETPGFQDVWNLQALVDGFSSQNQLVELDTWLTAINKRRLTEQRLSDAIAQLDAEVKSTTNAFAIGSSLIGAVTVLVALGIHVRRRRIAAATAEQIRTRIARDLHDDLGSRLGGIRLLSEVALDAPDLPEALRADIQAINAAASDAVEAMRDIVWLTNGRACSIDEMANHLHQVARETLGPKEWTWTTRELPAKGRLAFKVRRHLLLAFRETLGNVLQHADARKIAIELRADKNCFMFRVRDDGVGFETDAQHDGMGLENLHKRAKSVGGVVKIESGRDKGTLVEFCVPWQ